MTPLRLEAERVALRDFTGDDTQATAAIVGDDRVTHWLAFASMTPEASATAAVRRVVQFAFDDLKLHRISAAVGPQNVASLGVLEHLGFRSEGRLRDHVHTNGAWRDSLLYSVLEDEWRATMRHQ